MTLPCFPPVVHSINTEWSLTLTNMLLMPKPNHRQNSGCSVSGVTVMYAYHPPPCHSGALPVNIIQAAITFVNHNLVVCKHIYEETMVGCRLCFGWMVYVQVHDCDKQMKVIISNETTHTL